MLRASSPGLKLLLPHTFLFQCYPLAYKTVYLATRTRSDAASICLTDARLPKNANAEQPPAGSFHQEVPSLSDSVHQSGAESDSRLPPHAPYPTGRVTRSIPPITLPHRYPDDPKSFASDDYGQVLQNKHVRRQLLHVVANTESVAEAWEAYHKLFNLPRDHDLADGERHIPFVYLNRLARLLASTRPRTRTLFLRLLSVLSHLQKSGGQIKLWQWNALIDCAGKGWRKTRPEDFRNALDIFSDMVSQNAPGMAFTRNQNRGATDQPSGDAVNPDIVTYTTLLNIAARTLSPASLQHATSLLKSSGIPPNRITHLSLLRYFTKTKQLSGVRETLSNMKEQGLEVGLDGVNAVIWAFGFNNQMEVASTIYRVLRHSILPEYDKGEHDIDAAIRYLADAQGLVIPKEMIPNEVTYMIMIQTFAYHGDLIRALHVFMDFLSSLNLEPSAPRVQDEHGNMQPTHYAPTITAFRALFLGFARHGRPPPSKRPNLAGRLTSLHQPTEDSHWTLDNLHALFNSFLRLPGDVRVPERIVYWVLVAFGKTSGHDAGKLRRALSLMEKRFGGGWGGRLERIRAKIATHDHRKAKDIAEEPDETGHL
jgi:hypothetical protein